MHYKEALLRRKLADIIYPQRTEERDQMAAAARDRHRHLYLLFHTLWSAAGTPKYDKKDWQQLESMIEALVRSETAWIRWAS